MTAARWRRGLRIVVAALAAGLTGSVAAGFGARLVMWVIRLQNGSHDGEVTHASSEIGRWTLEGTLAVVQSALSAGALGGVLYLLLRRVLPGPSVVRGLGFGLLALALFGGFVLAVDYEYVRYVDARQSVALFAALFPLFGVVAALVADAVAPPPPARERRWPWLRWVVRAALVVLTVAGAADLYAELASAYRF